MMKNFLKIFRSNLSFGLTLSGGGARGYAHIGVLKALEEADLKIDYLSGTSMGSVMGAAYAGGLNADQLAEIAIELSNSKILWRYADPAIPRKAIMQGKRIIDFFDEYMPVKSFEELEIPLTVVAVDIIEGKEVHFNSGSLLEAVRASISVPGVLEPVEKNGMAMVDGGLLNNMPVDAAMNMGAEVILGIDVGTSFDHGPTIWQMLEKRPIFQNTIGGMIRILGDSLELLMQKQFESKLEQYPPDFMVRPEIPPEVGIMTGYDKAELLIEIGYQSVQPILEDLRKALKR